MATEPQLRVNPTGAFLRDEPSTKARVISLYKPGTIVHMDHVDGDWLFVEVRGWMHKSTVTVLKGE
ncbi:MAG: hypothetical protein IPK44_01235 [Candidatus Accumulibacter sp.]|uniref:SH3 domain-containing protein n=1 Tax=Accumulibacter sp. TaxID=2053492 RepID=UPI0025826208|nr:SH3 domain-containing protein [Accumulibacter sp.]MBK8113222.1 hypothetical protein [Accumulibacter sp.]